MSTQERIVASPKSGIPVLLAAFAALPCGVIALAIVADKQGNAFFGFCAFLCAVLGILLYRSLVLVNPNQSKVMILFGKYTGSISQDGFFAVNPFTIRRSISLRLHNFNSDTLKVNDNRGNPVEIGAVVVWKVHDTAQAAFDVEDYESFVAIQTESALRHLATCHPYDIQGEDENLEETSLRGSSETINEELKVELSERLAVAGIEVSEARLQHLAYAPEIASAMLQRQQADAIISARTRIVDGAVGMVKMALDKLREEGVVDLDEERKAQMTSNLLVVLCSDRATQPVVNSGSIH